MSHCLTDQPKRNRSWSPKTAHHLYGRIMISVWGTLHARIQINLHTQECLYVLVFNMHSIKVLNQCLLTETSTYSTSKAHLQGLAGLGPRLGGWRRKLSSTSSCEGLRSEAITPVVIHAARAHAVVLPACSTSAKINNDTNNEIHHNMHTSIMGNVHRLCTWRTKNLLQILTILIPNRVYHNNRVLEHLVAQGYQCLNIRK